MKRSELKEVIRQAMLDEITVVDKDTKLQDLPGIDPKKATSAIQTARTTQKPVNIAEESFTEGMDSEIKIGNRVKASKEYGGLSGKVVDIRGSFIVVKTKEGDEVYHESDLKILGIKDPLDMPMNEDMDIQDQLSNREFGMDYNQLGPNEKEWVRDEMVEMYGGKYESVNEAPYTMTTRVLPQDYDRITGKINSGLVEMGHWLEQNYAGNALPELQSIQDAYTEFDNKIAHGDDEEYEGGDLGVPGDNALGLEDALIAEYRK